jgi:hypothetical protein
VTTEISLANTKQIGKRRLYLAQFGQQSLYHL